jgi:hypothetical protein
MNSGADSLLSFRPPIQQARAPAVYTHDFVRAWVQSAAINQRERETHNERYATLKLISSAECARVLLCHLTQSGEKFPARHINYSLGSVRAAASRGVCFTLVFSRCERAPPLATRLDSFAFRSTQLKLHFRALTISVGCVRAVLCEFLFLKVRTRTQ